MNTATLQRDRLSQPSAALVLAVVVLAVVVLSVLGGNRATAPASAATMRPADAIARVAAQHPAQVLDTIVQVRPGSSLAAVRERVRALNGTAGRTVHLINAF